MRIKNCKVIIATLISFKFDYHVINEDKKKIYTLLSNHLNIKSEVNYYNFYCFWAFDDLFILIIDAMKYNYIF